jgi:hypothetical protein
VTATPRSDLGVDVTTGAYGEESTDVVVRRCIECGELRLEVAGGARELAAALVAAADKLDARS